DETVIPDIRMTRSRDGETGQAIFVFEEPDALGQEMTSAIAGMFLVDEEGELVSREVRGRFVNGRASAIEATYTWKTPEEFERFMRFAQRYAKRANLDFTQS
ncbi:photosystem II reaction center protein Psb28, partial [Candidatus Synechococcus spongiarum LMB bulk10E]